MTFMMHILLFHTIVINSNIWIVSNLNTEQPFYNLYNTDLMTNDFDHDCFYSSITKNVENGEKSYKIEQSVEYCIRSIKEKVIHVNEKVISSRLPIGKETIYKDP